MTNIGNPDDPTDALTFDEYDAALLLEYLEWRVAVGGDDLEPPWSTNIDEFRYAHENQRAWDLLPNMLPGGNDHKGAKALLEFYAVRYALVKAEKRMIPSAKVTRTVVWDPSPCPQCRANTDPDKVPVHPGCQCDVRTESIETDQPADKDIQALVNLIEATTDIVTPDQIRVNAEPILQSLAIKPETVVAIDGKLRFSDLLTYVSDHEDLVNNANSFVGLLIDDEDYADERESDVSTLIFINDLTETPDIPQWTVGRRNA